jgi:hypothetical protein
MMKGMTTHGAEKEAPGLRAESALVSTASLLRSAHERIKKIAGSDPRSCRSNAEAAEAADSGGTPSRTTSATTTGGHSGR